MRTQKSLSLILFGLSVWIILFSGCADRLIVQESAPGSNAVADAALAQAEQIMEEAGIAIDFRDLQGLSSLADLREVLPSPLEIAVLEDAQIDSAVSSLYEALAALGQPVAPAAPTLQVDAEISHSDLAMLHLHLGYLYVLGAIARLERVKGDLYVIDFPEEFDPEDPSVYSFKLTDVGQARIDAVTARPNPSPGEYLALFTPEQRQAVVDSLRLLVGARVVIDPFPEFGVFEEQRNQVDPEIYRRDALFHFVKAMDVASDLIPELEDALAELRDTIAEYLAKDMLNQIEKWGFRVENEAEVLDRIERLR